MSSTSLGRPRLPWTFAVMGVVALVAVHLSAWAVPGALARGVVQLVGSVAVALGLAAVASRRPCPAHGMVKESEQFLAALIARSAAGIAIYHERRVVHMNARLRELLGRADDESVVGSPIFDLFHPEDRPRIEALAASRTPDNPIDLHYECRMLRQDGSHFYADTVSFPVQFHGRWSVVVNIYDITDRKLALERQQALAELTREQEAQLVHSTRLAELGEMVAAVAHELNQPLTGIRNYAKNALFMIENDAGGEDEIGDNLKRITAQVDRAARIIGQMRDLARRSTQEQVPVDVVAVVRECLDFLGHQLRLSGIEVHTDFAAEVPEVQGDRMRLTQVFLNVITNARQAMEEVETRRLDVRVFCRGDGSREVVAEIADTGKGFDAGLKDKIFAPFYTTKPPGQGTGLGLSISFNIVKQHGGRIDAQSGEQGARFVVSLPVASSG